MLFDILLIIGLVVALVLVLAYLHSKETERQEDLMQNGKMTEGVVERRTWTPGFPSFVYYSFKDNNNTQHNARKQMGIAVFQYKKGERISVYYDPANPWRSTIPIRECQ